MEGYESYFKLFKSSWGILIGFRGEIVEKPEKFAMNNLIEILFSVYFSTSFNSINEISINYKYFANI